MLDLLLVALCALPPKPAAYVAAWATGAPVKALLAVCHRESRCRPVGLHERDAHIGPSSYGGQVRLRHLEPSCQARGDGRRWSTRGAWGLNAASHWQFMPPCYQPEWFDVPIVSALVAAWKWIAVCEGRRRRRWCPARYS